MESWELCCFKELILTETYIYTSDYDYNDLMLMKHYKKKRICSWYLACFICGFFPSDSITRPIWPQPFRYPLVKPFRWCSAAPRHANFLVNFRYQNWYAIPIKKCILKVELIGQPETIIMFNEIMGPRGKTLKLAVSK